jgi:hypothetical protein
MQFAAYAPVAYDVQKKLIEAYSKPEVDVE